MPKAPKRAEAPAFEQQALKELRKTLTVVATTSSLRDSQHFRNAYARDYSASSFPAYRVIEEANTALTLFIRQKEDIAKDLERVKTEKAEIEARLNANRETLKELAAVRDAIAKPELLTQIDSLIGTFFDSSLVRGKGIAPALVLYRTYQGHLTAVLGVMPEIRPEWFGPMLRHMPDGAELRISPIRRPESESEEKNWVKAILALFK